MTEAARGPVVELCDSRIRLRDWRDEDLPAWAAMNADPEVMAHFPATLSRAEADAAAARIRARLVADGHGLWALQTPELPFAGFVGLAPASVAIPPALVARLWPGARAEALVEVAWRLARPAWGRGDATRAAALALGYARDVLGLPGVVSFTATPNTRSEAVMRRLGLVLVGEFDHPRLQDVPRLRRHRLYATEWPPRAAVPAG